MDLDIIDSKESIRVSSVGRVTPKDEPEENSMFVASGICETSIKTEKILEFKTEPNDYNFSEENALTQTQNLNQNQPNVSYF